MLYRILALAIGALLLVPGTQAQQSHIPNYETARDEYFWRLFYVFGGETVYCGIPFGPYKLIHAQEGWPSLSLTVEHAYPADWIAEARGCEDRDCEDPIYQRAAADLHNLWPAVNRINSSRGDTPFGEGLQNAQARFSYCPAFRRTYGNGSRVEPRAAVRGDLARSVLYMRDAYDLPLSNEVAAMMLRWHRADPPGEMERWRNFVIEKLEGVRNPYVDGKGL